MRKIAIVGFGCAAVNAIIALRESGVQDEIHVFSRDETAPYNPMLTTYFAAGKLPYEGLFPFGTLSELEQKYRLNLHMGVEVSALNPETMSLTTSDGSVMHFDDVLLATGAEASVPPLGVTPGGRVLCMRTLDDAVRLKEFMSRNPVKSALVVGASMVGVKLMELLCEKDVHCTLADMADRIFPLSAFPSVSELIRQRLIQAGVALRLGSGIRQAKELPDGVISTFSDGEELKTDLLLLCIGTRSNVQLAQQAGLEVGRGIRVAPDGRTSHPHICAAGDCCETVDLLSGSSGVLGLWANAAYQGHTAGCTMAGANVRFAGNLVHNITHFMGMDFISIGDVNSAGTHICSRSADGRRYIELVRQDDTISCVNLLDSFSISGVVRNYMLRRVTGDRSPLAPSLRAMLAREGFDDDFLNIFEGGDSNDRTGPQA